MAVVAQHHLARQMARLKAHEPAPVGTGRLVRNVKLLALPAVGERRRRRLSAHERSGRSALQKLEHGLLAGVGLCQHRRGGLLHDLRLGQLG